MPVIPKQILQCLYYLGQQNNSFLLLFCNIILCVHNLSFQITHVRRQFINCDQKTLIGGDDEVILRIIALLASGPAVTLLKKTFSVSTRMTCLIPKLLSLC